MIILILVVSVIFADQLSKFLVRKYIPEKSRIEVIKDKFFITNVRNTGASYGVFSNNRKMLLGFTGAAFISLFLMFGNVMRKSFGDKMAFALILGGGLGNLYDRLNKKYVTDFLFIKFKNAPIFNIADIAIFIGGLIMVIKSIAKKN